jgi:DNA-binding transcriptional ArsR family regulator
MGKPRTRQLPALADRISFLMHRINAQMQRICNPRFERWGVDLVTSRMLVALLERGQMSSGDIVRLMALPQSTISHQLKRLEALGYVAPARLIGQAIQAHLGGVHVLCPARLIGFQLRQDRVIGPRKAGVDDLPAPPAAANAAGRGVAEGRKISRVAARAQDQITAGRHKRGCQPRNAFIGAQARLQRGFCGRKGGRIADHQIKARALGPQSLQHLKGIALAGCEEVGKARGFSPLPRQGQSGASQEGGIYVWVRERR